MAKVWSVDGQCVDSGWTVMSDDMMDDGNIIEKIGGGKTESYLKHEK